VASPSTSEPSASTISGWFARQPRFQLGDFSIFRADPIHGEIAPNTWILAANAPDFSMLRMVHGRSTRHTTGIAAGMEQIAQGCCSVNAPQLAQDESSPRIHQGAAESG